MTALSVESSLNEKSNRDSKVEEYVDILEKLRRAGSQYTEERISTPELILQRSITETLDDLCLDATQRNPNLIVPWLLISSYLYYHCDFSILTDTLFDDLCGLLLKRWDSFTHRHMHLITNDDLEAGSLFALTESDYPAIVRNSALQLVLDHYGLVAKESGVGVVTFKKTGRKYIREELEE